MTDRKYQIDTPENRAFLKEQRDTFLRFGRQFASPGGSAWYLHSDGSPWPEKNRETFETSRFAHCYSMGLLLGFPGSRELVEAALKGLTGEQKDKEHGGWYVGLKPDGSPMEGKLCYTHAFSILAGASAMTAGVEGGKELLEEAAAVYDKFFWDEEEGMARDVWNTEFTECDDYRGMNSNMHSVEAFLAASDATGDEKWRRRAGRIIERTVGFAGQHDWRLPEHYSSDWVPDLECNKDRPDDQFKPYGATPGHGAEWARLITQWALSAYPDDMEKAGKYITAAENMFCRSMEDGWNCDGARGIVYTTDWDGKPVVHDRMYWVLAEAINTSATLYRVTGKEKYAQMYADYMKYLDEVVVDHELGGWYSQLDSSNHLIETVWPGKNDIYHGLQATIIPYYKPGLSIASAIKAGDEI